MMADQSRFSVKAIRVCHFFSVCQRVKRPAEGVRSGYVIRDGEQQADNALALNVLCTSSEAALPWFVIGLCFSSP